MRFKNFEVNNFKGINHITFPLTKFPETKIFTLVGLNESGKTTILEAINSFAYNKESIDILSTSNIGIQNKHDLIPISKRDNFNGFTELKTTVTLDKDDIEDLKTYLKSKHNFSLTNNPHEITISQQYEFKNSKYQKVNYVWNQFKLNGYKGRSKTESELPRNEWQDTVKYFSKKIPSILYFPNFLFDFPERIYLEETDTESSKHKIYKDIIQDILNSLENDTNIETHIVNRIKSTDKDEKRHLDALLNKMSVKLTSVIFSAWRSMFNSNIVDKEILIKYDTDENDLSYLEFQIKDIDGNYLIKERSLGFRWFFVFLLLTHFRSYRKDRPQNMLFIFDEPASNLHQTAQSQLLKCLDRLTNDCYVIYTTHSHHLINPNWLEGTYVVKNEGLNYDDTVGYNARKTNITLSHYRDFIKNHPNQMSYYQPILDVLDYAPSSLEQTSNAILVEGKNDFYFYNYFSHVVFKDRYNLKFFPSTGSGNLSTLISLFLGWGYNFYIILDSDKEGIKQRNNYIELFGPIITEHIILYSDINPDWDNIEPENLISIDDITKFVSSPQKRKATKKQINRSIQEHLMLKIDFEPSEPTTSNVEIVFNYLENLFRDH